MNSVFMFAEDFVSHLLKTMCVGFFFFLIQLLKQKGTFLAQSICDL